MYFSGKSTSVPEGGFGSVRIAGNSPPVVPRSDFRYTADISHVSIETPTLTTLFETCQQAFLRMNDREILEDGDLPAKSSLPLPRWLRDFVRYLPLKSQFVLSGNILDLQAYEVAPGTVSTVSLQAAVARELYANGYRDVLSVDRITEPVLLSRTGSRQSAASVLTRLGCEAETSGEMRLDRIGRILERVVNSGDEPTAIIVDFASRLSTRIDLLSSEEHTFFTRAHFYSCMTRVRPAGSEGKPFFNTVVWIVDKEGDLPDWMLLGNPKVRHIPISRPDHVVRRAVVPGLLQSLSGGAHADEPARQKAEAEFVDQTEGLLLADLQAIAQLGRNERLRFDQISDAVRRYKVGVTEDPWRKIDREKIRNAREVIQARVKGQNHAVEHLLDLIKRAITGVGRSKQSGRPRGVVFLAGPTGVGKTELAKTITSLLFGDESAYIRFDMSEFSAEHADQRLIGAPPGYVGYDVGGELTNAVRDKPFSVILFDEIEKAHPRILDKFLQILDDGVLTSGRGDRVYFSESLIIFTSNLGIYRIDAQEERLPNVSPTDPAAEMAMKVRTEIERYFKSVLNRPELLNRLGENIIVFDFIRPDIAREIFTGMVDAVLRDIEQSGIEVTLAPYVWSQVADRCLADLSHGGRGIRNQVEYHLINPLSRALFDVDAQTGSRWQVTAMASNITTNIVLEPA